MHLLPMHEKEIALRVDRFITDLLNKIVCEDCQNKMNIESKKQIDELKSQLYRLLKVELSYMEVEWD